MVYNEKEDTRDGIIFHYSEAPILSRLKISEEKQNMLKKRTFWEQVFRVSISFVAGNKSLLDNERAKGKLKRIENLLEQYHLDDTENRILSLLYTETDEGTLDLTKDGVKAICLGDILHFATYICEDIELVFEIAGYICKEHDIRHELAIYNLQDVEKKLVKLVRSKSKRGVEIPQLGTDDKLRLVLSKVAAYLPVYQAYELAYTSKRYFQDIKRSGLATCIKNSELSHDQRKFFWYEYLPQKYKEMNLIDAENLDLEKLRSDDVIINKDLKRSGSFIDQSNIEVCLL